MVGIPENVVTVQDIVAWSEAKKELVALQAKERLLRDRVFKGCFPTPKEGTNTYPLAQGWELKGKYVINRDIDEGVLTALLPTLAENNISADALIRRKPELVMSKYKELTAEQQKLFNQCIIMKPGSAQLEIVLPKKNQPKD